MENLKNKTYKAFAWDFSGKIAGQSVGFIISIFLARLLTPADFGLLAMVTVIVALSSSLVDMGLGVALIQRKEVSPAHYGSVFFFNITVGVVLAAALFFSAPFVGAFYKNENIIPIARAMAALFIISAVGNVIRLKLRKELEYGIPTKSNLVAAVLSGAIGVSMAFFGYGVWSLVVQSLLNPLIANIYLFIKVRWRPKLIFSWEALKELWGFGFRMFISGILDSIFKNADSLIIGKLFSPSILGHFFRARSLNSYIVQYSSGSIMSVLFPAFSKVQDNLTNFKAIIHKSYHLICFLSFFLTGLFFLIGADLIILLFGAKWQPAVPMFELIILTAYGYPLSSILVNIIAATGNSRVYLKLEIIKKIFFGGSLVFGFIWGIHGYLICNAIAYALAVYVNIIFAGKQLQTGQWWFFRITYPYLLITVIVAGGMYWIQNVIQLNMVLHLFLASGLFVLAYVGITWLFKLQGLVILRDEIIQIKQTHNILGLIKSKFRKD